MASGLAVQYRDTFQDLLLDLLLASPDHTDPTFGNPMPFHSTQHPKGASPNPNADALEAFERILRP